MATVYDVGDPVVSRLAVSPYDNTTTPAVAVTRPDGTAYGAIAPVSVGNGVWTAQFTADMAGDWLAVWTVTGLGNGVQPKVYPVRALPSSSNTRPSWAPFLSDVADYVPRLTIDQTTPGEPVELGTFTGNTEPTDEQAQRLVDRAVTSVQTVLGSVAASLYNEARGVAALRAAAAVQRAYTRDSDSLRIAGELDSQADAELARLVVANGAAGASSSVGLLPVWAFPEPPDFGDLTLY